MSFSRLVQKSHYRNPCERAGSSKGGGGEVFSLTFLSFQFLFATLVVLHFTPGIHSIVVLNEAFELVYNIINQGAYSMREKICS